jgi:hypothetical protein
MPGRFEALDELLDEAIELPVPIPGQTERKMYRVESPSAKDGLQIERMTNVAVQLANGGENINTELLDDEEEIDLYRSLLGPVYDVMVADGVKWVWMRHVSITVLMWVSSGLQAAERFWAAAGNPELMAPNRETRRAQQAGSAAETSTRGRASTSGTNRNRGTKGRRRPAPQK